MIDELIVSYPACDWLTLTSYHYDTYQVWYDVLQSGPYGEGKYNAKRMQYAGIGGAHYFIGQGRQAGQIHYMVQVSGSLADKFLDTIRLLGTAQNCSCTRIDLQLTIEREPQFEPLGELGRTIRAGYEAVEPNKSRRPMVKTFDSGGVSRETAYIGSRSSRRFVRIYDKQANMVPYVRFEIEYKREFADQVFTAAMRDRSNIAATIKADLSPIPARSSILRALGEAVAEAAYSKPSYVRDRTDELVTLDWIEHTCIPVMLRLHNSGHRDTIRAMLSDMFDSMIE